MRNWQPLYDAAHVTGSSFLTVALFIGTLLSAIASANGCVNDAARAWFSMGRDRYLPEWFGAVHPTYRTPFRAIPVLMPIWAVFALYIPLAEIITFSILSGLLNYTFMPMNMWSFRKKWPVGTIRRGFEQSLPPHSRDRADVPVHHHLLRGVSGLWPPVAGDDGLLHRRFGVVCLLSLPLRQARRPVHHVLAQAAGLLRVIDRAGHWAIPRRSAGAARAVCAGQRRERRRRRRLVSPMCCRCWTLIA